MTGSIASTGTFTVGAAAMFTNSGTVSNNTGGSITNNGVFDVDHERRVQRGRGQRHRERDHHQQRVPELHVAERGCGTSAFAVATTGSTSITGNLDGDRERPAELGQRQLERRPAVTSAETTNGGGPATNTLNVVSGGMFTSSGTIRAEAGNTGTFKHGRARLTSSGSLVFNSKHDDDRLDHEHRHVLPVAVGRNVHEPSGTVSNNTGGAITNKRHLHLGPRTPLFNEGAGTATGRPDRDQQRLPGTSRGGGGASAFRRSAPSATPSSAGAPLGQRERSRLVSATVSWNGGPLTNAGTITASGATNSFLSVSGG